MKSNEYQVLARKYRPQYFDEVVGQLPIARTLKNAIQSKRVAHAYLLCGTRGVGKTSMARILAKSLNCLSSSEPTTNPCQTCDTCISISQGEDVDVIEIDGASNRGIDEIRNIQKEVGLKPSRSRFKIYIIDEVHMLTIQAFNALLKILEEPPVHVKFIFATTQAYDVPETIHSRCQRFDFRRVSEKDIIVRLRQICEAEDVSFDEDVLARIATLATGGMRDSQSILDQLISATHRQKLTLPNLEELMGWVQQSDLRAMIQYLLDGHTSQALHLLLQIYERGNDLTDFVDQLVTKFRALMIFAYTQDATLTDETLAWLETMAPKAQKDFFLYAIQLLLETQNKMKQMIQSKILLEMALVKLSQTRMMLPFNELLKRAQELEFKLIEKIGPLPPPVMVASPVVKAESAVEMLPETSTSTGSVIEEPLASALENESAVEESSGAIRSNEEEKIPEIDFQIPTVETLVSDFKLKDLWPQIVDQIKAKKASVGTFLAEGQFLSCDEMRILIGFSSAFNFHREQLETPEKKSFILQEVKQFTQQDYDIKFIEQEDENPQKEKNKITEEDLKQNKEVQKVVQFFNGRVIKVEK